MAKKKSEAPEQNNMMSENDPLDINELASLNEDYTPEFLEQLQQQLTQNVLGQEPTKEDDAQLFEEVNSEDNTESEPSKDSNENSNNENAKPKPTSKSLKLNLDDSIDDNFIKKYKAKLSKQQNSVDSNSSDAHKSKFAAFETAENNIGELTGGKIIEKPIVQEVINYNDSLDLLDENVKYSKYVIYIDPENTDFIESLTVKERKNLINKILREQDDVMLTKKRFNTVQAVIKHSIIAIITIAIAIPIIYFTINASLEASIDNYRRSKSMFHTLYKERGKIKPQSSN